MDWDSWGRGRFGLRGLVSPEVGELYRFILRGGWYVVGVMDGYCRDHVRVGLVSSDGIRFHGHLLGLGKSLRDVRYRHAIRVTVRGYVLVPYWMVEGLEGVRRVDVPLYVGDRVVGMWMGRVLRGV